MTKSGYLRVNNEEPVTTEDILLSKYSYLILGPSGIGKTRLLRYLRIFATERRKVSVYVDMAEVGDDYDALNEQILYNLHLDFGLNEQDYDNVDILFLIDVFSCS